MEAGYQVGSVSQFYFWADSRPNGGFFNHFVTYVPGVDYGHATTFVITRSNPTTTWQVNIYDSSGNSWLAYSTNNSMAPDEIIIGQEIAGSSGASAPVADFTHNVWFASSGSHYQSNSGSGFHPSPAGAPNKGVIAEPPAGDSNAGGDIETYCC